jgi:putative MATE family efflux protein
MSAPAESVARRRDARTRMLLEAPIVPTVARLAGPNVLVMAVLAATTALDAYFAGQIGPDALAGITLVMPLVGLMMTMAAGGVGGGISSAVARSLGSGDRARAESVAAHAVIVALAFALTFSGAVLVFGPSLYRVLGGVGAALDQALLYSTVMFGSAGVFWLMHGLGSVVRGSGNTALPARVGLIGTVIQVGLLWLLVPMLGIVGIAVANVAGAAVTAALLAWYLWSAPGALRPRFAPFAFRGEHVYSILRVGGPGAINTLLTNACVATSTGLTGTFGTAALAGFGAAARLEYILIPLVFGLGSAIIPLIGASIGAGNIGRARRAALVGALTAAALTGLVGLVVTVAPNVWVGLFTSDPSVAVVGMRYLSWVGPVYGFFGAGLALYFAAQGAGAMVRPVIGSVLRLAIIALGGWWVVSAGGGMDALFMVFAAGFLAFGTFNAAATYQARWSRVV